MPGRGVVDFRSAHLAARLGVDAVREAVRGCLGGALRLSGARNARVVGPGRARSHPLRRGHVLTGQCNRNIVDVSRAKAIIADLELAPVAAGARRRDGGDDPAAAVLLRGHFDCRTALRNHKHLVGERVRHGASDSLLALGEGADVPLLLIDIRFVLEAVGAAPVRPGGTVDRSAEVNNSRCTIRRRTRRTCIDHHTRSKAYHPGSKLCPAAIYASGQRAAKVDEIGKRLRCGRRRSECGSSMLRRCPRHTARAIQGPGPPPAAPGRAESIHFGRSGTKTQCPGHSEGPSC